MFHQIGSLNTAKIVSSADSQLLRLPGNTSQENNAQST